MSGTAREAARIAAVLMAHQAGDAAQLQWMVDLVRDAGAQPVVVVLAHGTEAPRDARVVRLDARAHAVTALRMGMAQLTNTSVQYALLWTPGDDARTARVRALVEGVPPAQPPLVAMDGDDIEAGPLLVGRAAWLELMTVGETGMAAVAARHPVHRVAG